MKIRYDQPLVSGHTDRLLSVRTEYCPSAQEVAVSGARGKQGWFGSATVALLGCLCLCLASCGSSTGATGTGSSATASAGAPKRGGSITIGQVGDPESLDPTKTYANQSILVMKNLYEMLYDSTPNGQGFTPWLATGYSLSADKLAWTFHLRHGVEFSNGAPMTSADVKFSIERAMGKSSVWNFIDDVISDITTPTPYTVVIHTKTPVASMLAIVSLYGNSVIPADFAGMTASKFFQHPMGTGPFMVTSWIHGQSLTANRNQHYWQKGKPYLNSVTWTVVPDDNTRLLQLEGHQIQVDEFPAWSQLSQIQSEPGSTLVNVPSTEVEMVLFNEHMKPFQDIHVRQAINLALNRRALVQEALFGHGSPMGTFLAPNIPLSSAEPVPAFNLAAAKAQMAKSTVPHGFSTTLNIESGSKVESAVGQVAQQELAPLGIHVSIQTLDPSTWFSEITAMKYQMSTVYVNTDIADSSELVEAAAGTGGNWVGWNDPSLNSVANKAGAVFSTAERKSLYRQYLSEYDAHYPIAALFLSPWVYALSDTVHGFHVLLTGNYRLADVWVSS
jgi:peptide/nickel transport system substrate-binding protein